MKAGIDLPPCAKTPLEVSLRSFWCGLFFLIACGSSEDPEVFLGPISSSSPTIPTPLVPSNPCQPPTPLLLDALPVSSCPLVLSGTTALGLATSPEALLLVTHGEIRALKWEESGCPKPPVGPPLSLPSASGPVAFSEYLWIAEPTVVNVWSADTQKESCPIAGVRSLIPTQAGALALTGSGIYPLEISNSQCSVGASWSLPGAPLSACASQNGGAWVALVHSGTCAAPVVSRYNAQGALEESAPTLEATRLGLCNISAMTETSGKLFLFDGTCKRGAVVDAISGKVQSVWEAPPGQIPMGAVSTAKGVLFVTASGSNSSATLRFFQATP